MHSYIALLRGINVGGRHRLPMKELVALMQAQGCEQIATYIQSGNVSFCHPSDDRRVLAERITDSILQHKGFAPQVWLFTQAQWQRAIDNNPFSATEGKSLHFFFLAEVPARVDLEGLEVFKAPSESFALVEEVFYLHAPDGIGRSKLVEKLGRYLPVAMTARNWNTVAKMAEMLP